MGVIRYDFCLKPAGAIMQQRQGRSSDLFRRPRLPGRNQWQRVRQTSRPAQRGAEEKKGTHSSRYCSGFAPDSRFTGREHPGTGTLRGKDRKNPADSPHPPPQRAARSAKEPQGGRLRATGAALLRRKEAQGRKKKTKILRVRGFGLPLYAPTPAGPGLREPGSGRPTPEIRKT